MKVKLVGYLTAVSRVRVHSVSRSWRCSAELSSLALGRLKMNTVELRQCNVPQMVAVKSPCSKVIEPLDGDTYVANKQ